MKLGDKLQLCALVGLALQPAAHARTANDAANPYTEIVARNVFGLKPPPPVVPPEDALKQPPVKVTLNGIITIFRNKRALLETPPPPAKPGGPPPTKQYYTLAVGQREGDIEVLEIDEKAWTVKLKNADIVTTLTFDKEAGKGAPAAPPGPGGQVGIPTGIPGGPGGPGGPPGVAPAMPAVMPAGMQPAGRTIPTRTLRLPGAQGEGAANSGNVNPSGFGAASAVGFGVPTSTSSGNTAIGTVALTPSPASTVPVPTGAQIHPLFATPTPAVDPDKQALIMEAAKMADPSLPPTPPTQYSELINAESGQSGSGQAFPMPPGF